MRPAPLDDMGVTIPDMDGKTAHSIINYEDAESLYIIDQMMFLIMRRRGKYKARSSSTEARQTQSNTLFSSL